MTFSRAAWLNIFFAILILLLLNVRKNVRKISIKKYFRMISFVFLIMLLLTLLIISDARIFGYRLGEFFLNRLGLQRYDQDRFEAQKTFLKELKKPPFLVLVLVIILCFHKDTPHIAYILECLEKKKGIFGFFLLLVMILVSLKNFWKIRKSYAFLFTGFMGTIVNFIFIGSWHRGHLWILFAIGFSLTNIKKRENSTNI